MYLGTVTKTELPVVQRYAAQNRTLKAPDLVRQPQNTFRVAEH